MQFVTLLVSDAIHYFKLPLIITVVITRCYTHIMQELIVGSLTLMPGIFSFFFYTTIAAKGTIAEALL